MKPLLFALICLVLAGSACKNSDKKTSTDDKNKSETALADSLMEQVMNGHDVGMSKMSKLKIMEAGLQRTIDSIGKLPQKSKQALKSLSSRMDSLLHDLRNARSGMEKWMEEFNMDSAKDNMEKRVHYLTDEKGKIENIQESILRGLQKADSAVKTKF